MKQESSLRCFDVEEEQDKIESIRIQWSDTRSTVVVVQENFKLSLTLNIEFESSLTNVKERFCSVMRQRFIELI